MTDLPEDLQSYADIATNMKFPQNMRQNAMEELRKVGSHEALEVLLGIAANESAVKKDREVALKHALQVVKSRPS